MEKRVNSVVAHGDLDGIISSILTIQKFGLSLEETNIYFIQPFAVDKINIQDHIKRIYVVDIAMNNRDVEMTKIFINRLGDRLVKWYDHHKGWSEDFLKNPAFIINTKAGSCAEIIGGDSELVADATAADSREGALSQRAQLIEQATKANMADDNIRQLAVKWLLGDESARVGLEKAAEQYAAIQTETMELAAKFHIIENDKIAVVDARGSNHQYDLTQLLLAGQKKAPFVVVTVAHPQTKIEGLTIATSRKDVDLVSLFGLPSGAPFRVTLPVERREEVISKLSKIV